MAKKSSDNFLRALIAQLQAAIDDGGELAYEFGELADEAISLVTPPVGDDDLGDSGSRDDGSDPGESCDDDEGDEDRLLQGAPDLGDRVLRRSHEAEGQHRVVRTVAREAAPLARAASGDARRAADLTPTCIRTPGAIRGRR